jgi:hypothetical protein
VNNQNDSIDRKKKLETLLASIAKEQMSRESTGKIKKASRPTTKADKKKHVETLFATFAVEQASHESWEKRQRYLYPPIIPEDIAYSVHYGVAKGMLNPADDSIAVNLMDSNEIRKTIQAGRLDPSELPLLKYRIDKLLGLSVDPNPPRGQEMLSARAYYYRGDIEKLNDLRQEVLDSILEDYQYGEMTAEEFEKYRREAILIIDQYLTLK